METTQLARQAPPANGSVIKLPTLAELMNETEESIKENTLMVLVNQPPPSGWLKTHPMTKEAYLPIERIEYLLSRIYTKWWVEIKQVYCFANSVVVTVRLYVINPVTGKEEWNEGIGAAAIQTDKGAGAMDWNHAKADGVAKAAPSAETYARKNAAKKFGKLFGKDLNRDDEISYTELLKSFPAADDLRTLYDLKKDVLNKQEQKDAERILNENEVKSFNKLHKKLSEL